MLNSVDMIIECPRIFFSVHNLRRNNNDYQKKVIPDSKPEEEVKGSGLQAKEEEKNQTEEQKQGEIEDENSQN